MIRPFLITAVFASLVLASCTKEYVEPDASLCIESWDQDVTMIHPTVILDYPGEENGTLDEKDIIFSDYQVQLMNADSGDMMMEAHVPDWMGHDFKPVPPGNYYMQFLIPDGFTFVIMEEGTDMFDTDFDSDVISQDGKTAIFEIQCHEQIKDLKAIIQRL